jgi:hypothetical protein
MRKKWMLKAFRIRVFVWDDLLMSSEQNPERSVATKMIREPDDDKQISFENNVRHGKRKRKYERA